MINFNQTTPQDYASQYGTFVFDVNKYGKFVNVNAELPFEPSIEDIIYVEGGAYC